jgi:hypothetical protein
MKKILLSVIIIFIAAAGFSQSLNGQWRGDFDSNGDIVASGAAAGDNTTEYVLEITVSGKKITGYSYSYYNNRQFFVMCAVAGTYDKANKTLDVMETARIKGSTPPDWNDCLQEHLLAYKIQGSTQILTGIWKSAKNQTSNCGSGYTTLIRSTISNELNTYNKSTIKTRPPQVKATIKPPVIAATPPPPVIPQDTVKAEQPQQPAIVVPVVVTPVPKKDSTEGLTPEEMNYEKRTNQVLQTIGIENTTFTVDLYDNGAIDGDSISLFYNDKVIISHKRLSDKAISITLSIDPTQEVNELTMYAENLGEIPPNTALMVINDGKHRYEVNVSSDLTTSGSIHFVHATPAISSTPVSQ